MFNSDSSFVCWREERQYMSSVSTNNSNPGTPMGSKRMGGHQNGTMEQHMLDGKSKRKKKSYLRKPWRASG